MAGETLVESDVRKFTGQYAIEITTCNNVWLNIPTDKRAPSWSRSHTDVSTGVLKEWAAAKVYAHLEAHKVLGTPPCQPFISPVFGVYKDIQSRTGVVWLSISE